MESKSFRFNIFFFRFWLFPRFSSYFVHFSFLYLDFLLWILSWLLPSGFLNVCNILALSQHYEVLLDDVSLAYYRFMFFFFLLNFAVVSSAFSSQFQAFRFVTLFFFVVLLLSSFIRSSRISIFRFYRKYLGDFCAITIFFYPFQ